MAVRHWPGCIDRRVGLLVLRVAKSSRRTRPSRPRHPHASAPQPTAALAKATNDTATKPPLKTPSDEPAQDTETERERALVPPARHPLTRGTARRQRERDEARSPPDEAVARKSADSESLKAARRDVTITMYSTSWCGVCSKARAYMIAKAIPSHRSRRRAGAGPPRPRRVAQPAWSVPTIAMMTKCSSVSGPAALESRIERAAQKARGCVEPSVRIHADVVAGRRVVTNHFGLRVKSRCRTA